MGVIEYVDFDLSLEAEGEAFRTTVVAAPKGAGASEPFPALDDEGFKQLLLHVSHPRDAVRVEQLARPAQDEIVRVKRFGAGLFGALVGGEIGEAFAASRRAAAEASTGLRLRLRLTSGLTEVPWEFLFQQALDRFTCLSVDTPLVRYLDVPEPIAAVNIEPPLRVLVMVSAPKDYPPLDVGAELAGLRQALAGVESTERVTLEPLGGATMEALHDRLLEGDVHVFHYIGHGGFDDTHQDGLLVLEGPDHAGAPVPGDDLGIVLHGHRSLRLAVLNTCQGAQGSPRDPFAGTAQGLIQQGVPAVIAMQFPISDAAATAFARRLYSTLALGYPVDAALCEARKSVYLTGHRLEWATPVLYTRSADGRIFSIVGAAPVQVRLAEVDPLVPAEGPTDEAQATSIVAGGTELKLEQPQGALLVAAEDVPAPRVRRPPLDLRPRDFPELLGRDEEVRTITAAFLADETTSTEPVEIFGPAGIGKTALVRNVAHHPSAQFPEGVVYTASRQSADDLLRFLFQTFYESDRPILPTEATLGASLHDIGALVVLDDVSLGRDELERLTNLAPRCLFVFCSTEQLLWQAGPAFGLRGLARDPAHELLERRLGRPISTEEEADARLLIEAVDGMPLLLVQAASRIRTEGLTTAQVLQEAEDRPSRAAALLVPGSLTEPETRVAAVLAAAGGPVGSDLLAAATGLPEAAAAAGSLEARGLVSAIGDRFRLTQPPTPAFTAAFESGPWLDRALEATTTWVLQHPLGQGPILEEADALLGMMRWGRDHARWDPVVGLGRAIERAFAIAARWDRWRDVLERTFEAAQQLGDRTEEAWALHQLGTRDIGLGRIQQGREQLLQALEIREELGDEAGAEVTRSNLGFAGGAPTPPNGPPPRIWPWVVGAVLLVAVIAAVLLWPEGVAKAALDVDPGSVEFGERTIDQEGDTITVTISSTGDQALAIGTARLNRRRGFQIESDTCSNLQFPSGTACSIVVSFTPRAEGDRRTTLIVPHNADGSPLRIELSGTGVPPDEGTPTPPPFADIEVVAPEGGMIFRSVEDQHSLTIRSVGTAPLEFQQAFDSLEGAIQFPVVGSDCPGDSTLAPDTECSITFGYAANYQLPTAATLEITSNAGTDTFSVTLTGEPVLLTEVGFFSWNDVSKRYEAVVTVSNAGTGTFEVRNAFIDPAVIEIVADGCSETTVIPGGSCPITVGSNPCMNDAALVIEDTTVETPHRVELHYDRCVE